MEVAIGTDPKVGKLIAGEHGQLEVVDSSKLIICKGTTWGNIVIEGKPELENLTPTEFTSIVRERMTELGMTIPDDFTDQVGYAVNVCVPEEVESNDDVFGVTRTLITLFNNHNEEIMGVPSSSV